MNDLSRDVQTACILEASARKAGNVHPFAGFDDLNFLDFILSAVAIGPVLMRLVDRPLGPTILEAIRATRAVVQTNTNLGIVLLLAPLSKCELENANPSDWPLLVRQVIDLSDVEDTKQVYEAIRLAVPGGMGKVDDQDIAKHPTESLREVMALAAERDMIARQYGNGFREIFYDGLPALLDGMRRFGDVEKAIQFCQIHLLSKHPDSLIARKRGPAEAQEVMRRAQSIDLATPGGSVRYEDFDRWLRSEGHSRNPGTTADLITACLFTALRTDRMQISFKQ
jgi:triphosphoribosyl-dephospho-CoA synthase